MVKFTVSKIIKKLFQIFLFSFVVLNNARSEITYFLRSSPKMKYFLKYPLIMFSMSIFFINVNKTGYVEN